MAEVSDDCHGHIATLETELKSERAQLALAERTARIGCWRMRLSDGSLSWSPGMYRLLNLDPATQAPDFEWLQSHIRPEDVAALWDKITAAIRTGSPFYYRTHALDPTLPVQIVDTHGEIEVDADGRAIAVIGISHDLTQQMQAEAERLRAEKLYRVMMEEASDIIMLHGPLGRVEFASAALERILGRTLREFDSIGYLAIVHPEDRAEAEKIAKRPPPGETYTVTCRAQHAEGHYVWLEVTTRSVFDEATGEFRHVVAVLRDVGERKLQELEMKTARDVAVDANRAKSTFLANMSHELRTPLNAILGFADIMRDEMFGPVANERYREYVSLIHSSGQLLLELIGDILDMAKIEAGKLELKFESLNVSDVVDECVQIMTDRARRGGVALDVTANGTTCIADRRALKQIVLNVLSNAVKFTPAGGRIEIEDRACDDCIRITVADTGIGIAPEDLPRLGNPFEQVCADPTLSKKGTGLGLALVRALAEKHGGKLAIESRLHCGTTVTVELPRLAAMPAQVA